jgi:type II secretory pathway pseudopilin PulG
MTALRTQSRRGISLLEVLVSMGILSVGLASVLALIPAGKLQSKRAAIEDRRGALGASALEDCVNRGLLRTTLWSNTSSKCIAWDSLFTATTGSTSGFPNGILPINLKTVGTSRTACDEVFRGQDDLVFSVPDDDDSPPEPRFVNGAKRLAEGHFSWLATLVPADASPTPQFYRLSVVEFHKRPFDATPGESWRSWSTTADSLSFAGNSASFAPSAVLTKDAFNAFFKTGCVVLGSDPTVNHRWLRVLMASPTESSDGTTVTAVDLTFDQDPNFTPTILYAYAGAVGVAEKIVRLEGDSPWVTQ